jgi:hypothetical protein
MSLPPMEMSTVVRIDLGDLERHPALPDYFLRLGAFAALDEHGSVTVSVREDDDLDVEYLRGWTDVNGAPATVRPALMQPAAGERTS